MIIKGVEYYSLKLDYLKCRLQTNSAIIVPQRHAPFMQYLKTNEYF